MMGNLCFVILVLFGVSDGYVRLPRDVTPMSYHLTISPEMNASKYTANMSIILRMNNTNRFFLDCEDLEIIETSMTMDEGFIVPFTVEQNSTRLKVMTSLVVAGFHNITFNVAFRGKIRRDLTGFYLSQYQHNGTRRYLGSTQFESSDARKAFPCFDEPYFVANFNIEFLLEPGWKAICNTPLALDQVSGQTRRMVFETSRRMPTYLVAWVVYDEESFGKVSVTAVTTCGNVTYNFWSNKLYLNQSETALEAAPIFVHDLEQYTGIKCDAVRDKMDLVAIPDFSAGAMENWGLITFRESMILWDPEYSTAMDRQLILMVVAHELTHQWFGNLVTPDWWSFVWLSEGFARYLQYLIAQQVYPEMRLLEQFIVERKQTVMSEDSESARPLTAKEVNTTDDMSDMFDVITYDKGASILHMMASLDEGDSFITGVNKYLSNVKESGGVTNPDAFFSSFPSLRKEMMKWSEAPGYPIIVVDEEAASIRIHQIKVTGWNLTSPGDWLVPVTIYSNGPIYTVYLEPNQTQSISVESNYLLNVNQTGYYRVLYNNQKKWLSSDVSSLTRSQLIDDATALASDGLLPYSVAIEALEYHLKADKCYIVWTSGLRAISTLSNLLQGTSLENPFKERMLDLMEEVIDMVGFNKTEELSHLMKLQQMNILKHACKFGHSKCQQEASNLISDMSNVSPEKRSALLCTSVKTGNSTVWEQLWSQYKTTSSPVFQKLIIQSLACTNDTSLISRFQNLILSGEVRRQDAVSTLSLLASSPEGAEQTLALLKTNYTHLHNYFGEIRNIKKILLAAAKYVNDSHLTEIRKLSIERKELELDSLIPKIEKSLNLKKIKIDQLTLIFSNSTTIVDNNNNDDNNSNHLFASIINCFLPLFVFVLSLNM